MPYVKPREIAFQRLQRLLRGYGITPTKMTAILNCSYSKARDRADHPDHLTLGELDKISKHGHVPWDEIREAILIR